MHIQCFQCVSYRFSYEVSKTINALMEKVFDWCTDFREDDPQISGSPGRYVIVQKSKDSVVFYWERPVEGKPLRTRYTVHLYPPNKWTVDHPVHFSGILPRGKDAVGEDHGEYLLESLGDRTRLTMKFNISLKERPAVPLDEIRQKRQKHASELWDAFIKELEREIH